MRLAWLSPWGRGPNIFGAAGPMRSIGSVAALANPRGSKKVADASAIQTTGCDHAVVDDDATAPSPCRHAIQATTPDDPAKHIARGPAVGIAQFGGVEVRQPNLDPGARVRTVSYTKPIPVSHVSNLAGKSLTRPVRQASLAGVCVRDGRDEEEKEEQAGSHQATLPASRRSGKRRSGRRRKGGGWALRLGA